MNKFGLIGYPLSHSFSPKFFKDYFEANKILDSSYELFPLERIEDFENLKSNDFKGLNVTIPYKKTIITYLDEIDYLAEEVEAVNTILFRAGKLKGYNTDVFGFEKSLMEFIDPNAISNALILGSGGAAQAVAYVLKSKGIKYQIVSRQQGFLQYQDIDEELMDGSELIINTTPLGMSPYENNCPNIPYNSLSSKHYLFDLIYNPEKTLFLKKGEQQNAKIKNGMDMLTYQALKSWEIWNNE